MNPVQAINAYQELPLTPEEFHKIDTNLTPYMRLTESIDETNAGFRNDDGQLRTYFAG